MENEEQEELKNVITEENKNNKFAWEGYKNRDDLIWYFLVFNNYSWGSSWWFYFSNDD
jgi:hypothetical protein